MKMLYYRLSYFPQYGRISNSSHKRAIFLKIYPEIPHRHVLIPTNDLLCNYQLHRWSDRQSSILIKSDSMLFHISYVFKIVVKEICNSNLFPHILVHFTISNPFTFRYGEINTRARQCLLEIVKLICFSIKCLSYSLSYLPDSD